MRVQYVAVRDRFLSDPFLRSSGIVFIGSFLVNVLNYFFTIFTARMVQVESYGEFTTLLSLLIIFSVPSSAIGLYMTREVSRLHGEKEKVKQLLDKTFAEVLVLSLLIWLCFLLLVPFMHVFFMIDIPLMLLFSFLIPLSMWFSFMNGYFQGEQRFSVSTKLNILSTVLKLVVSLGLLAIGMAVYGIVFGLIFSVVAAFLWQPEVFKGRSIKSFRDISLAPALSHLVSITLFSSLLTAFLSNIDVLLAKHYLSAYEAGAYGALSTMGKIIIFAVGSFVTVMIPFVSKEHGNSAGNSKTFFLKAITYMIILGLAIVLCFNFFPEYFVHILFGKKYESIISYVGVFSIATFLISLSIAFINYFISIRNTNFIYLLLLGILVEVLALWYTHSSIGEYVESVVISSGVIFVLLVANFYFDSRKRV
jgi:O-antigen/teichoic acid export membrane protein